MSTAKRSHAFEEQLREIQSDISTLSSKLTTSHPSNGHPKDLEVVKSDTTTTLKTKKKKSGIKDSKNGPNSEISPSTGVETKRNGKVLASEWSEVDDKTAILDLKRSLRDVEKSRDKYSQQYESALEEVVELKAKLADHDRTVIEYSKLKEVNESLVSKFDSSQRICKDQKELITLLQQQLNDRNMQASRSLGMPEEMRSLQSHSVASHSVSPSVIALENKSWLNAPVRGAKSCNESIVSGLSDSTRSTTGKAKRTIRRSATIRSANSTPTRSNLRKRGSGNSSNISSNSRLMVNRTSTDKRVKVANKGSNSTTTSNNKTYHSGTSQALVTLGSSQGYEPGSEHTIHQKQRQKSMQLCYGGRSTPQRERRDVHSTSTSMVPLMVDRSTVDKFKKSVISQSANPGLIGTPSRSRVGKPPLPPSRHKSSNSRSGSSIGMSRSAASTPVRTPRRERYTVSVPSSPVNQCTFGSGHM